MSGSNEISIDMLLDRIVGRKLNEPVDGEFQPNDEVDEVRWITAAEAATLLSYEHDRRLVSAVDDISPGGS